MAALQALCQEAAAGQSEELGRQQDCTSATSGVGGALLLGQCTRRLLLRVLETQAEGARASQADLVVQLLSSCVRGALYPRRAQDGCGVPDIKQVQPLVHRPAAGKPLSGLAGADCRLHHQQVQMLAVGRPSVGRCKAGCWLHGRRPAHFWPGGTHRHVVDSPSALSRLAHHGVLQLSAAHLAGWIGRGAAPCWACLRCPITACACTTCCEACRRRCAAAGRCQAPACRGTLKLLPAEPHTPSV